jgi:glycolate oxidase FAD binding subunit
VIDLACVREAGPADKIAGIQPRWVATPPSTQVTATVLRAAAERDLAVVPRGSGTRLTWGRPPSRCDLIIETTQMNQVVEHEAGDLVARIQAGATFGDVAEVLARAGQRISLDAPPSATIGGVIADGLAGPLRFRFGSPRDLLIGITIVRADGVIARSGGKVVKNVAGYDLGKLLAGSRGTLGVITEATFRLHPIPAAAQWLVAEVPPSPAKGVSESPTPVEGRPRDTDALGDEAGAGGSAAGGSGAAAGGAGAAAGGSGAAAVAGAVARAANSRLAASAVELFRAEPGAPYQVGVLLEGTPDGVKARADAMIELLGDGTRRESWKVRSGGSVRVTFWVSALARVLAAIDSAAAEAGVRPAIGGSAGTGVLDVWFDAEPGPFVAALRSRLPAGRGSVTVLGGDMLGDLPGLGLMRAIKQQFDPGDRMAPGRMGIS